jgi:hypothetical protein
LLPSFTSLRQPTRDGIPPRDDVLNVAPAIATAANHDTVRSIPGSRTFFKSGADITIAPIINGNVQPQQQKPAPAVRRPKDISSAAAKDPSVLRSVHSRLRFNGYHGNDTAKLQPLYASFERAHSLGEWLRQLMT